MGLIKKLKINNPFIILYPIIVIIAIPVLLIINTILNIRAFNRDANHFIRQQAISIAETTTPFFEDAINRSEDTETLLDKIKQQNSEVISASLIKVADGDFELKASSEQSSDISDIANVELTEFAAASGRSFAGLSYDPFEGSNVWNVSVPFSEGDDMYILAMKLSTETVDTILQRTSRDSLIILAITTIVTLILLANHFIFYRRSLHAEQLAEIDRLKDEFISLASHELRAPVTAIVGYLEMLRDKLGPETTAKVQHELDTLNRVTHDLNNLINDLLEVSRIEQDRIKINKSMINVNEIIQDAIDKFQPQAEQKGLQISFSKNDVPEINSDPDRVRQIVVNLLSNSIKYTNQGTIAITSMKEENMIKVIVKDSGVGIPPEEVDRLFTKFHRVKDKNTPEAKGTGLGLWITKKLVETLGGKIYVESIYGTGTSFSFTLPLSD